MANETSTTLVPPRANPLLRGHDTQEARVRQWMADGRLGQALLICGPPGIGKATWAFRIARSLLRQASAPASLDLGMSQHPPAANPDEIVDETFRWVASGTHPDLLTVERRFDDKRGRALTEIVVDDVRKIGAFLASSPALGGWRVVIVDAADEMNRNAANALLKVLEEPGADCLLILVAHQPGLLPATVRSRCRQLTLRPLDDTLVAELIGRYLPGTGAEDTAALCRLAEGSIGRALHLAAFDGLRVHRALRSAFDAAAAGDTSALLGLATDQALGADEDRFRVTAHILSWWLRRIARCCVFDRQASAVDLGRTGAEEECALQRIAATAPLDRWQKVWDKTQHLVVQAVAGNFDRRQIQSIIFLDLQRELCSASS